MEEFAKAVSEAGSKDNNWSICQKLRTDLQVKGPCILKAGCFYQLPKALSLCFYPKPLFVEVQDFPSIIKIFF